MMDLAISTAIAIAIVAVSYAAYYLGLIIFGGLLAVALAENEDGKAYELETWTQFFLYLTAWLSLFPLAIVATPVAIPVNVIEGRLAQRRANAMRKYYAEKYSK